MAATSFTPISLYYSTTASAAPTAGNLVAGELAINTADGKLFYKDSAGVVQTIASKATGTVAGSTTQIIYNNAGAYAGSANLTFNGSALSVTGSILAGTASNQAFNAGWSSGGSQVYIQGYNSSTAQYVDTAVRGDNLLFYTNAASNTEKMRIDSSGNVGIGTSSPSALGASLTELTVKATTADKYANLNLIGVRDVGGNQNGLVNFWNNYGTLTRTSYIGGSNTASSNTSGELFFVTANAGTLAERMRITSTGNVGIAVTPSAWDSSVYGLQIGGQGSFAGDSATSYFGSNCYYGSGWKYIGTGLAAQIYNNAGIIQTRTASSSGSAGGAITWTVGPYVAAGGTSWTNASDAKLKNITGEISDALTKVNQLRAAEFTWKSDESAKAQVGLIAQDVQSVLPQAVVVPKTDKDIDGNDTFLGVNYDQVIPLLVASIKELNAKVDAQSVEIATLKAK